MIIALIVRRFTLMLPAAALLAVLLGACGGDDQKAGSPSSSDSGGAASAPARPSLVPPLEGSARGPAATQRTDFSAFSEWQLPKPEALSPPSSSAGLMIIC